MYLSLIFCVTTPRLPVKPGSAYVQTGLRPAVGHSRSHIFSTSPLAPEREEKLLILIIGVLACKITGPSAQMPPLRRPQVPASHHHQ
jgi:hypothetical protein